MVVLDLKLHVDHMLSDFTRLCELIGFGLKGCLNLNLVKEDLGMVIQVDLDLARELEGGQISWANVAVTDF